MALTKLVKITDTLGWALWKINTGWHKLLSLRDFSSTDLQALESISHPQKKAEYLASRLALYALLDAYQLPYTSLLKDTYGKPFALNADYHLSLANSFPYGTAIINLHKATGIDIEQPSGKLLRVQHKFLHEQETNLLDSEEALCLAWCTKECLYKLYGRKNLSFKNHIRITDIQYPASPFVLAEMYHQQSWHTYELRVEKFENYFIVLSV